MGLGIRAFVLGVDGHFKRVPYTRYERLWARDGTDTPADVFSDHAGKDVCFAVLYLDMEDRQPIGVRATEFRRFKVRPDGRIDVEERERGHLLTLSIFETLLSPRPDDRVIDSAEVFLKKRHRREFLWTPTHGQNRELRRLTFGR